MKKIVLFFNISATLFLLNASCTYGAAMGFSFKTVLQQQSVIYDSPSSGDLIFDVCFEDILDDDDNSNDSEGKKKPSEKITQSNTSFVAHNFSDTYFKNSISTTRHTVRKTPLFIFIRVLRL